MSEWVTIAEIKDMGWEPDEHGNVVLALKFSEHLKGAMIRVKNRPEVGQKLYGHFEATKTGKGQWFKKDQVPEGVQAPSAVPLPLDDISNLALLEAIQDLHNDVKRLLDKETTKEPTTLLDDSTDVTDDIDLNEIPF